MNVRTAFLASLLTLFAMPGVANATSSPDLYQASYDLEANRDYSGALDRIQSLRRQGEDGYVVHLRRGWLLYLLGRYGDSASAYRAAIKKSPASVEARQGLILPLMALRRWSEAEGVCREILGRAPRDYTASSRLAYALYSSGRYADASKEYARVLEHYPSDVEMRAGLGWSLLKQGQAASARATFKRVLHFAPSHVSATQGLQESG